MNRRCLLWTLLPPIFCLMLRLEAQAAKLASVVDCKVINFPDPISFGTDIDILTGAAIWTGGSGQVQCTGIPTGYEVRFCIGLSMGGYVTAVTDPRKMANGTNRLNYNIYLDSNGNSVWTTNDLLKPYVDLSPIKTITSTRAFFARLDKNQQSATVGKYTDTININSHFYVKDTSNGQQLPADCNATPIYARPPSIAIGVTATITPNCYISSTNITFDPQTIITTDLLAESALTVKCTNDPMNPILPYISLDDGQHAASGQRQMENEYKPGNFISYDLYSDSQRLKPWRSTHGVNTVAIPRSASDTSVPVYGKIPKPDISPAAGPYKDRITATVNF